MINYYQPWLLPFLKPVPNKLPPEIKSYYYHSFEDGLWDLIKNKFPPGKELMFLVPDFYCSDVLDNIRLRGHDYIYYPLDKNFQISLSLFKKFLWLNRPDVVIIFHACGITSNLTSDLSWWSENPSGSVVIEDSVHRLIDPAQISIPYDNYFIMDSLRKVSPLPGSRLLGTLKGLSYSQTRSSVFSKYFLSSMLYYLLFRICLDLGFIYNSSAIITWSFEKILKTHDDIIGDSFTPQSGFPIFLPLIRRLNYQKVQSMKRHQVALYQTCFSVNSTHIPQSDYGLMHAYPLTFLHKPSSKIIQNLKQKKLPVWFKFTDTPWSVDKSVLFLPLGFHIRDEDIQKVSTTINNWFSPLKLRGESGG